jgi:carbon monoxide dehydrogenase subunit G
MDMRAFREWLAMQIKNSFEVPLPPAETWAVLMDVPRIAPCMPGAELLETIDERTHKGKVSVKLGPVALSFTGTATFEEIDSTAHRALLKAQGSDTKGRGRAEANVTFNVEPAPGGSQVNVVTDVVLSGAVAQYGRGAGLIQSVATQLVGQFADNLRNTLVQENAASPVVEEGAPAQTAPAAPARPVAAKPISGFSLMFRVIWDSITGLFASKPRA